MDIQLKIEVIKIPDYCDRDEYAMRVSWLNSPVSASALDVDTKFRGDENPLQRATEAVRDMLAYVYGDDRGEYLPSWRAVWNAHRHYITRTVKRELEKCQYPREEVGYSEPERRSSPGANTSTAR